MRAVCSVAIAKPAHTGDANGERKTERPPARHEGNRHRADRER